MRKSRFFYEKSRSFFQRKSLSQKVTIGQEGIFYGCKGGREVDIILYIYI